jgi:hypothetical protein
MMTLTAADQLAALRSVLFETIADWNGRHPHRLRSHHEHGSVSVTQVYADAGDVPSYTVTVTCTLAGTGHLAFHGYDLPAVIEHARLTLEHRLAVELAQREEKARDDEFVARFGIAV